MSQPSARNTEHREIQIANRREQIEDAERALLDALKRFHYPESSSFAIRLALEECLVNAFRHGHKNLSPETPVRLTYDIDPDRMVIDIEDQGPGFDPSTVKDPTLDENLEIPTGRGLLLMRAYMASVEYLGRGNHVRMVYQRPDKA
jgi:serine/threonine-protein kinase RsbW